MNQRVSTMVTAKNKRESLEHSASSVKRVVMILDEVAKEIGGLTLTEIVKRLDLVKSTASYTLRALEKAGYLSKSLRTKKYRLGLKIVSLSHAVLRDLEIRSASFTALENLFHEVGKIVGRELTVHVG